MGDTPQLGADEQAMVDQFEATLKMLAVDLQEASKMAAISRAVRLAKEEGLDVQQINDHTVVVKTRDGERVLIGVDKYSNVLLKKVD